MVLTAAWSTPLTLIRRCGVGYMRAASSEESGRYEPPLRPAECRSDAVTGGGVVAHDDVAGLLAARVVAVLAHRLGDVAVTRRCAQRLMPCSLAGTVPGPGYSSRLQPRCPCELAFALGGNGKIAIIWSPSSRLPFSSPAWRRSESPSCAIPRFALCSATAACSFSGWVEPTPSLMLVPSGLTAGAMTSAPVLQKQPEMPRRPHRLRSPEQSSDRPGLVLRGVETRCFT